MFDFASRLRGNRPQRSSSEESRGALSLLLVTRDGDLYLSASDAASRCGWQIRFAETLEEGLQIFAGFPARVVIYDWDPESDNWPLAVDRLTALPHPPRILLASRVIDEYLSNELLSHGGFDVIPRSAGPDELIRTIRFADRSADISRGGKSFTS